MHGFVTVLASIVSDRTTCCFHQKLYTSCSLSKSVSEIEKQCYQSKHAFNLNNCMLQMFCEESAPFMTHKTSIAPSLKGVFQSFACGGRFPLRRNGHKLVYRTTKRARCYSAVELNSHNLHSSGVNWSDLFSSMDLVSSPSCVVSYSDCKYFRVPCVRFWPGDSIAYSEATRF